MHHAGGHGNSAYGDPHSMDDDDSDILGLMGPLDHNPFGDLFDHDEPGHSRFAPHTGGRRDRSQNPRRGRGPHGPDLHDPRGARRAHPMDPRDRHPGADRAGNHRDPHGHPGGTAAPGRRGGMPRGRGGRPRGPDPRDPHAGFGDHRPPDHPFGDSDSDSDYFDFYQDLLDGQRRDYEEEMTLEEEMAMREDLAIYEDDFPMGPPARRRGPRMGGGGMMGGRRARGPHEWI